MGDEAYLFSANAARQLTGYSHGLSFGGAARGESFGRYLNSLGEEQFPAQWALTFGTNNFGPRVGPVVISEVLDLPHPPAAPFVELQNITASPINLFDVDRPTNTWRVRGLGFTFPKGITIPARGLILLTSVDPATFRTQEQIPPTVQIFQYPGTLRTNGEPIELLSPEVPGIDGVPYFIVDRVHYGVPPSWGVEGPGASFQRIDSGAYGDDPVNWQILRPTPGWTPDALPQPLRLAVQLDPLAPGPSLSFVAAPGRAYLLQYKTALGDGSWTPLATVPALSSNRTETILDSSQFSTRFYRISTPHL
jgi:hypothetical protein